jgi:hypothetical protein
MVEVLGAVFTRVTTRQQISRPGPRIFRRFPLCSRLQVLDCSIHSELKPHAEFLFVLVLADSEIITALPPHGDGAVPLRHESALW